MKKTLIQKFGLLGVISFLSYAAAVIFSPLAYPGYNRLAQAVSDLSAANAPSLALWNRLTAFYNVCETLCITVVCIGLQGKKNKAAARRRVPFRRDGSGFRNRFSSVPVKRQRIRGKVSGRNAYDNDSNSRVAFDRLACRHNSGGNKKQKLPLLRNMRGYRARHDACGRVGNENRSRGVFRRGGTFQRFCRDGF